MGASGCKTRHTGHETLVHDCHLEEVFGESPGFEIVRISLADFPQKAHWAWPAQLELEHTEHEAFCFEDLVHSVTSFHHVLNLPYGWALNLFVLRSNQDCSRADELEFINGHHLAGQEPINVVDAEEQGLGEQLKAIMHLNEPIHKHRSH